MLLMPPHPVRSLRAKEKRDEVVRVRLLVSPASRGVFTAGVEHAWDAFKETVGFRYANPTYMACLPAKACSLDN